jgi:hypothetical protein
LSPSNFSPHYKPKLSRRRQVEAHDPANLSAAYLTTGFRAISGAGADSASGRVGTIKAKQAIRAGARTAYLFVESVFEATAARFTRDLLGRLFF